MLTGRFDDAFRFAHQYLTGRRPNAVDLILISPPFNSASRIGPTECS
jgi:hypothetical protein